MRQDYRSSREFDDRSGPGNWGRRGGRGNGPPIGDRRRGGSMADRLGPQGPALKSTVVAVTNEPPVDREKVRGSACAGYCSATSGL